MSVVAHPLPVHTVYTPTGPASAHAELPPIIHSTNDTRPRLVPFPVFHQRHSSPYPMATQSFSALGPPQVLAPKLPVAPKPSMMTLPALTPTGSDTISLPPTPDPSPPNSKVLFPDAMVKLAPPAEDDDIHPADSLIKDHTPRRLPIISLNSMGPPPPPMDGRRERPKSMGPLPRPMRRSQTAIHPSSIRMVESNSADSRIRTRSSAMSRPSSARASSPGLPRSITSPMPDQSSPRSSSAMEPSNSSGDRDLLEAKVVLLGSQGVGKTSLILRCTTREFPTVPATATIGSSLHTRKLTYDGVKVKLQVWDTAGQERFRSMAPIYYRGAHVCVLVYDISDRSSFQDVKSWLEELSRTVPKETVIYIVGSKIDLQAKRVVSREEAHWTIRGWLKHPEPPVGLLPPSTTRSLFRSASSASRGETTPSNTSVLSTPARSHSHTALTSLNSSSTTIPPPRLSLENRPKSPLIKPVEQGKVPFPVAAEHVSLQVSTNLPTSPRNRRISFPALQSPTLPTSVTFTEPIKPDITPASPSRHGTSAGRFSISGVLGYSRTPSFSGAASNLARLAEDYPAAPKPKPNEAGRSKSFGADSPVPRPRHDSTPLLSHDSGRRKSEDWSSRSWRMGEGPRATDALDEFGAGIKKKLSGELLGSNTPSISSQRISNTGAATGRARGGSLGRDSRLYATSDVEEDSDWGIEVEGMRVGEVSSLTGEGVEALFRSISALLVEKREKIERERTLRRKDSIMLTDPHKDASVLGKTKGRCC